MFMSHVLALVELVQKFFEPFPSGEDTLILQEDGICPLVSNSFTLKVSHPECNLERFFMDALCLHGNLAFQEPSHDVLIHFALKVGNVKLNRLWTILSRALKLNPRFFFKGAAKARKLSLR